MPLTIALLWNSQPNEYFFDTKTNKLHFWYNGTTHLPPPSISVPTLANLLVSWHTCLDACLVCPNGLVGPTSNRYRLKQRSPDTGRWSATFAQPQVVKGTKEKPVENITIGPGLQFVDTRPTYMDPRTNPSGGDWALERCAIHL